MILSTVLQLIFWISVIMIAHTYAIYPAMLLLFARKSAAPGEAPGYYPTVSFLTSVYNEEKVLGEKIANLLAMNYPKDKLDIVFVSDGSTDSTASIISRYADSGIRLIDIKDRAGKVSALNSAVPQCRGDIIVFSDANTIYEKDAVSKLVRRFSDPAVGCVCGELIFYGQTQSGKLEGFYWAFEQFLKKTEGAMGSLLGANGGIYAIRRELFTALPGDTIVEDFVLPMKILEMGYKTVYEPSAVAREEITHHVGHEMERRIRIGAGDFQALTMTWRLLHPKHGFSAFAYLSHKVIRWFVPFFMMAALISNTLLAGYGFYGVLLALQLILYSAAVAGWARSVIDSRPETRDRRPETVDSRPETVDRRPETKYAFPVSKTFDLAYYFVTMNVALLLGFVRFCTSSQSVMWKRTER